MSTSREPLPNEPWHSPLTRAVAKNQIERARELLPASDVNWQGIFGNTALHWAVANSKPRMASMLLSEAEEKLDVNVQDNKGKTALHLAIGKGWYHFDESLPTPSNEPPQALVIQTLMEKNDLTLQDHDGNTVLHIAVLRRDPNCVEALLNKGAKTDIANHAGHTPIDLLNLSFEKAEAFIRKYVQVFTLDRELWDHNKKKISELLGVPCDHSEEEKCSHPDNKTRQNKAEADAPADCIFETAIIHMQDSRDNTVRAVKLHQAQTSFLNELIKLKDETLRMRENGQLNDDEVKTLAHQALTLSEEVAHLTVDQDAIDSFHNNTARYRRSSTLGKILGAIVGAIVGAAIGVMAGMAAGPAAAFTALYGSAQGAIIGAGAGGSLGAGLGFWCSRRYQEARQPLLQLEARAKDVKRINVDIDIPPQRRP